jgi:hypothetical protein
MCADKLPSTLLPTGIKIKISKTIILSVLNGYETRLTEECRLIGFKNVVIRKIFGPEKEGK